jgi:hypothetical protein
MERPKKRRWITPLLALSACACVAILLTVRIAPSLVAEPERRAAAASKPTPARTEIPVPDAPQRRAALLLPPPPAARAESAVSPPHVPPRKPVQAAMPPPERIPENPPAPKSMATPVAVKSDTDVKIADAPRQETAIAPGAAVEAEGRVLLRILEHGSGPDVEIAWPASVKRRRALYRLFEHCYGMMIAVMDSRGRLYAADGAAGRPWQPNLDRYSGFIRQPAGELTPDERDRIAVIRARHGSTGKGGLDTGGNVRLFPRRLDSLLLGGLKTLIGDAYSDGKTIHARYSFNGKRVLVEDISIDDHAIAGRIDLSKAAGACHQGGWS